MIVFYIILPPTLSSKLDAVLYGRYNKLIYLLKNRLHSSLVKINWLYQAARSYSVGENNETAQERVKDEENIVSETDKQ